jgi:putative transposase
LLFITPAMSRPPRIQCFDYRGLHRYFLTVCTLDRARHFTRETTVSMAVSQILQSGSDHDIDITTYCVMPDHIHLLATGTTEAADLCSFMKIAKQKVGWDFRQEKGTYLWQDGFYDHVLRTEDATPAVIRYIINNPVRAGLVSRPQDYPSWGSQTYSREELLELIQGVEEWTPLEEAAPGLKTRPTSDPAYSARSATSGSTRMARRAGM